MRFGLETTTPSISELEFRKTIGTIINMGAMLQIQSIETCRLGADSTPWSIRLYNIEQSRACKAVPLCERLQLLGNKCY